MRFTIPTLFGITFACAVLTGFVALPSDFQRLITAAVFLLVGIASGLYLFFSDKSKESRMILTIAAILMLASLGVLIGSLRPLWLNG
jgi:hypothetical protein